MDTASLPGSWLLWAYTDQSNEVDSVVVLSLDFKKVPWVFLFTHLYFWHNEAKILPRSAHDPRSDMKDTNQKPPLDSHRSVNEPN